MHSRSETVAIRADAGPIDGQFRGIATLAKPGVYPYSDGVNTWTEWTPADTLTDPEYMDSLKLLPVTLDHPSPPIVDASNARSLAVGGMGDTVTADDSGMLSQPIAVWDGVAASAARTTHKQISLGYQAMIDATPGVTPDGTPYDRKQVKRKANHVALVEEGRHGPRIRVRADSNVTDSYAYAQRVDGAGNLPAPLPKLTERSEPNSGAKMATVKLGNATVEVADNATALAIQSHVDSLNGQVTAALAEKTRADTAEGKLAAAIAAAAAKHTAHADAKATATKCDECGAPMKGGKFDSEVAKGDAAIRVALETKAAAIIGGDWKADGKTNREIRIDALKALKVEFAADASDDYLAGALDFKADAKRPTTADVFALGLNGGGDNRADSGKTDNIASLAAWK